GGRRGRGNCCRPGTRARRHASDFSHSEKNYRSRFFFLQAINVESARSTADGSAPARADGPILSLFWRKQQGNPGAVQRSADQRDEVFPRRARVSSFEEKIHSRALETKRAKRRTARLGPGLRDG